MTFGDYQTRVNATWRDSDSWREQVLHAALGLTGEAGEVAEIVKKSQFHARENLLTEMPKELGDVLYYVAKLADLFGVQLETVAQLNADKLAARYPNGWVEGGGIREGVAA